MTHTPAPSDPSSAHLGTAVAAAAVEVETKYLDLDGDGVPDAVQVVEDDVVELTHDGTVNDQAGAEPGRGAGRPER